MAAEAFHYIIPYTIMETVKLNGVEMHTVGEMPKVGDKAPEFTLVGQELNDITLADFKGKRVVLNIFPSLDTDVCAASVRHFNKEASELPNTAVICVSMDLPFAAARFCTVNGIDNVFTGSGFRSHFGRDYGVEIADGPLKGLYDRSLVVIDENGVVLGTSFREDIAQEPDYEFVKKILTK